MNMAPSELEKRDKEWVFRFDLNHCKTSKLVERVAGVFNMANEDEGSSVTKAIFNIFF